MPARKIQTTKSRTAPLFAVMAQLEFLGSPADHQQADCWGHFPPLPSLVTPVLAIGSCPVLIIIDHGFIAMINHVFSHYH